MPLFALTYRYIADPHLVSAHRPDHRAYLRSLADAGQLLLAGPLGEPGPPGGLLIVDAENSARIEELADNDPFHAQGIVQERSIRPWTLSIGGDRLEHGAATAP